LTINFFFVSVKNSFFASSQYLCSYQTSNFDRKYNDKKEKKKKKLLDYFCAYEVFVAISKSFQATGISD